MNDKLLRITFALPHRNFRSYVLLFRGLLNDVDGSRVKCEHETVLEQASPVRCFHCEKSSDFVVLGYGTE